jgi:uncharacterized membrane protein YhhN
MLFFGLYIAAALANVFSIRYAKRIIRPVSKICLMPLLMLFYLFNSDNLSFALAFALFFSWCGDIALVHPRKFGPYAGIASFFAAHILYAIAFAGLTPKINAMAFVFSFLPVLSIECLFIAKLSIPNKHKFFALLYGIAIGLLVVASLQVFMGHRSMAGFLPVIGSVLFFVSDAILAWFTAAKTIDLFKNPVGS